MEITEREQKLLDALKVLIKVTTVDDMYYHQMYRLSLWRQEQLKLAGLTMEWQDEMLHMLESEYGLKYIKLQEKEDGTVREVKDEDETPSPIGA